MLHKLNMRSNLLHFIGTNLDNWLHAAWAEDAILVVILNVKLTPYYENFLEILQMRMKKDELNFCTNLIIYPVIYLWAINYLSFINCKVFPRFILNMDTVSL